MKEKKHKGRRVYCVELDREFDRIKDAAEELGISQSGISRVCSGKEGRAGGYHWRYVDNPVPPFKGVCKEKPAKRKVYCPELDMTFESMAAAARHIGVSREAVRIAYDANTICKGYHFIDPDKME